MIFQMKCNKRKDVELRDCLFTEGVVSKYKRFGLTEDGIIYIKGFESRLK